MNAKEVAGALRETAARHLGTAGEVAARLYALADSIDPPRTMAMTLARTCTCDVCGDQIAGLRWIGEPCVASAPGMRPCAGRYRLDPEPDEEITTADGTELGVTRDRLAMEAAMMTFLADDPDNDEAIEVADVASGHRGRAR